MIPIYNPNFLELYTLHMTSLGFGDIMILFAIVITFVAYGYLAQRIFPRHYIQVRQLAAIRDVQKAKIKREYIEHFEKIL